VRVKLRGKWDEAAKDDQANRRGGEPKAKTGPQKRSRLQMKKGGEAGEFNESTNK